VSGESQKTGWQRIEPDTIVAVATPPGLGAVAVIRMSGPEAWGIARKLCADPGRFDCLEKRRTGLLRLVRPGTGDDLDRSLIVKYEAPESFTGEDLIEFHCHGGVAVQQAVTRALIDSGGRQALAGEFTRRAFLNGKLDLAQAEAVDELVHARGDLERRAALAGLSGELGQAVGELRNSLIELKAQMEYEIDFPEEEHLPGLDRKIEEIKIKALESLGKLLEHSERNVLLSRGVLTVIAGAPNVGKSSLFNALLGQERSIVTVTAGTTRDAVEMETLLDGVLFRLVDTAGLREGTEEVERLGIEFSRRYLEQADLILFVHEAGKKINGLEEEFISGQPGKRLIRVLNKVDLPRDSQAPEGFLPVSAKSGVGIADLKAKMSEVILDGNKGESLSFRGPQVTSLRQKNLLEDARSRLAGLDPGQSVEYLAADLAEICDRLAEVTGAVTDEDVLEKIFQNFCIGK
jgi:tRNA modification GTPase